METQIGRNRELTDDGRFVISVGDITVIETRTTSWRAASAEVGSVELVGRRRLRRMAPPDRPVPRGQIHAYRPGSSMTACGQLLGGFHTWEDQPFSDRLLNRCHTCLGRIRPG